MCVGALDFEARPQNAKETLSGVDLLDKLSYFEVVNVVPQVQVPAFQSIPIQGDSNVMDYQLHAMGRSFQLRLTRNGDLFADEYEELSMDGQGRIVSRKPKSELQTDCYWRGWVVGDEESHVVASTCNDDSDWTLSSSSPTSTASSTSSSSSTPFTTQSSPPWSEASRGLSVTAHIVAFGENIYVQPAQRLSFTSATSPSHPKLLAYEGESVPHVVYRMSDYEAVMPPFKCGLDDGLLHTQASFSSPPSEQTTHATNSSSGFQLMSGNMDKYVEVGLFHDPVRSTKLGSDVRVHGASVINAVANMYRLSSTNLWGYNIHIRLKFQVIFVDNEPYGNPTMIGSEVSSEDLLNRFTDWRHEMMAANILPDHDNGVLLSGHDFEQSTVGLAWVSTMCSSASSSVNQVWNDNAAYAAKIVGHEMGHNFGMWHDDGEASSFVPLNPTTLASCAANAYIMSPYLSQLNTQWSECSRLYLSSFLSGSGPNKYSPAMCLENLPAPGPICGDGVREGDEECDCGPLGCAGVDPCCDQATCKLKPQASCSAMDACCTQTCQLVTDTTTVCRAAVSSCDIPERCDGINPVCPLDTYSPPGSSCAGGMCFELNCLSHASQCAEINPELSAACPFAQGDNHGTIGGPDSCGLLHCASSPFAYQCSQYLSIFVADGTPCKAGQGQCWNKKCTAYASLPKPPVTTYRYHAGDWSSCSCLTQTQTRPVSCVRDDSTRPGYPVSYCSGQTKPSSSQPCSASCTYDWSVGSFGACSANCGSGTQTRTVLCMLNGQTVVADTFCTAIKPVADQVCNTQECGYHWNAGSFGPCSKDCDGGVRIRDAQCLLDGMTLVADSLCPAPKPNISEACNIQSCTYQWSPDPWGPCNQDCETGLQTRTVKCMLGQKEVDSTNCTLPRPQTFRECNTQECQYSWVADMFPRCETTCGYGYYQTRPVQCRSFGVQAVDEANCVLQRPINQKPTALNYCPADGCEWRASMWSQCTEACGNGTQSRSVHCAVKSTGAVTMDWECPSRTRPPVQQACNTHSCYAWKVYDWEDCSEQCQSGTQTRHVVCVDVRSDEDVSTSQCDPASQPASNQLCNTQECPSYIWYASEYSKCPCGNGTQSREVYCASYYNQTRVVSSFNCDANYKLREVQNCKSEACTSDSGSSEGGFWTASYNGLPFYGLFIIIIVLAAVIFVCVGLINKVHGSKREEREEKEAAAALKGHSTNAFPSAPDGAIEMQAVDRGA